MDVPAPEARVEPTTAPPGIVACPFLVSSAGPWRQAEPTRDHRCARRPPEARLDLTHQRELCLGTGGPGCPSFIEARAPGRLVSMLPIVIDRGPLGATLEQGGIRRAAAPATVVIVGLALGALVLARGPGAPGPGTAGSAASSASPSSAASPPPGTPTPSQAPTPTPTPAPSVAPSLGPSPVPSASPAPPATHTYTIRPGDTLSGIATRFGTTTQVLAQLNGIKNPSLIRAGEVLKLP